MGKFHHCFILIFEWYVLRDALWQRNSWPFPVASRRLLRGGIDHLSFSARQRLVVSLKIPFCQHTIGRAKIPLETELWRWLSGPSWKQSFYRQGADFLPWTEYIASKESWKNTLRSRGCHRLFRMSAETDWQTTCLAVHHQQESPNVGASGIDLPLFTLFENPALEIWVWMLCLNGKGPWSYSQSAASALTSK